MLLLVSVIVFVLLHLLPGGPARAILGVQATPQPSPTSTTSRDTTVHCPSST